MAVNRQYLECPLPLPSPSNKEKLQKLLLFTYVSAQNKYLRNSCISYQFSFHILRAVSILSANYFENFHIDKICCIIWCLMIETKLPEMASAIAQPQANKYDILVINQTIPEEGDLCYISKRTCFVLFSSCSFYPQQQPILSHWWVCSSVETFQNNWGLINWD